MAVSNFVKNYKPVKKNKYRAIKCTIDGHKFDSKKEAKRYLVLKDRLNKNEIYSLSCQRKIDYTGLDICGEQEVKIFTYIADFCYFDGKKQKWIYEDVKGMKTPVYRLKKKLIEDQHRIKITEI
jgi:hypothetical protein